MVDSIFKHCFSRPKPALFVERKDNRVFFGFTAAVFTCPVQYWRDLARRLQLPHTEAPMLYFAMVFFIIAVLAALMGFGGIAVAFAGVAKILFFLFVILFLVSLVMHLGRRV